MKKLIIRYAGGLLNGLQTLHPGLYYAITGLLTTLTFLLHDPDILVEINQMMHTPTWLPRATVYLTLFTAAATGSREMKHKDIKPKRQKDGGL